MSKKADDWIRLVVKYNGKCAECGKEMAVGEYALWSRSSKAIKHVKCETPEKPKAKEHEAVVAVVAPPIVELDCFICGKPAGCAECSFEADCNRAVVSQACICNNCMRDKDAYLNYQQAFLERMRKVAKVKA